MDVQQQGGNDRTGKKPLIQAEGEVETPETPQQAGPGSAKSPDGDRRGYGGSNDSLTDIVITNEDALLLPDHVPVMSHKLDKETLVPVNGVSPPDTVPVCTPPAPSTCQQPPHRPHVPQSNGHNVPRKHRPSTSRSQQSLKTGSTQIQETAGDDCCVHCVLACLFCELLPMCSAVAQCLACGTECDALCCCCCGGGDACGGLACCSEDSCSALMDCVVLEDCCQSSECLEICLECCSICYPT